MSRRQYVNKTLEPGWHARLVAKKQLPAPAPLPEIGRRIGEARDELGLTQKELAKQAKIRAEALSRLENGRRGLDSAGLARLLIAAAEVGISMGYVLRGTGDKVHPGPLVLTQDPALMGVVAELGRLLVEKRREKDGTPSEPDVPGHKRRKP